jgi:hypothetical protein
VIFAAFWGAVLIEMDEDVGPLGAGAAGPVGSVGRGETVGDHETVGRQDTVGRHVTVGGSVPVGIAVTVGRNVPVGLHVAVGLHVTVGGSVGVGEGVPLAGTADGTSLAAWRSRRPRKLSPSSGYPPFAACTTAKTTSARIRTRLAVS